MFMSTAGTDYWKAAECQYLVDLCFQAIVTVTTIRNLLKVNIGWRAYDDFYAAAV